MKAGIFSDPEYSPQYNALIYLKETSSYKKGEGPENSMTGAGIGTLVGSAGGKITNNALPEIGKNTPGLAGTVVGSVTSEVVGGKAKDQLDASTSQQ